MWRPGSHVSVRSGVYEYKLLLIRLTNPIFLLRFFLGQSVSDEDDHVKYFFISI